MDEKRPAALSAFGAIFLALGGAGLIASGLALLYLFLTGALASLEGSRLLLLGGGVAASAYQVFVGISIERPRKETQSFAFHFSLYACLLLVFAITWNALTSTVQGILVGMIALPYTAFYGVSVWYFWRSEVQRYFENVEKRIQPKKWLEQGL